MQRTTTAWKHHCSTAAAAAPVSSSAPSTTKATRTSLSDIGGRLAGASLLCFSIDPHLCSVYFLLGKERYNAQWPYGSDRWSDFGGKVTSSDRGPEETAAREFFEETMALVRYFPDDTLPRKGWQDIADDLKAGDYVFKLTQGDCKKRFVVYVKQVPWDPDAVGRFASWRYALTKGCGGTYRVPWDAIVNHPGVKMPSKTVRKQFLEKRTIGFWSVPQLQYALEHGGIMTRQNGKHVEHCRSSFLCSLELIMGELMFHEPTLIHPV